MIRKVYVPLDETERSALAQLAQQQKRDPRAQAAMIIRRQLEKLGLINAIEVCPNCDLPFNQHNLACPEPDGPGFIPIGSTDEDLRPL